MKLQVFHETTYRYDQLIRRSIQMLRMTPPKTQRQHILHWELDLPAKATPWMDAYGNHCHCLVLEAPTQSIVLRARGLVEFQKTPEYDDTRSRWPDSPSTSTVACLPSLSSCLRSVIR